VSRRQGIDWHTDVTFVKRPRSVSYTQRQGGSHFGGDTLWSTKAPLSRTSARPLQSYLSTLHAVHDGREAFKTSWSGRQGQLGRKRVARELEPVWHPIVRTHPETGEKVLFVNPGFTSHIVELAVARDDALLILPVSSTQFGRSSSCDYSLEKGATGQGFLGQRSTQHAVVGDSYAASTHSACDVGRAINQL